MKAKRIIAFVLIAILLGLAILTFIAGLTTSPEHPEFFRACLLAIIIVPVFVFALLLVYRLAVDKRDENRRKFDEIEKELAKQEAEGKDEDDSDAKKPEE